VEQWLGIMQEASEGNIMLRGICTGNLPIIDFR